MINRRNLLLTGFVAPAVVIAANIMPVKVFDRIHRRYVKYNDIANDRTIWRMDWSDLPLRAPLHIALKSEREFINAIGGIETFLYYEKKLQQKRLELGANYLIGIDSAAVA